MATVERSTSCDKGITYYQIRARYEFVAPVIGDTDYLLDVGCGEGWGAEILSERTCFVTGIDIDGFSFNFDNPPDGVHLREGDICDAPYINSCFTIITCFDVLEHVVEPAKAMKEMYRLLKPGGKLYLTTPNGRTWREKGMCRFHIDEYPPELVNKWAVEAGFSLMGLFSQVGTGYTDRLQKSGVLHWIMRFKRKFGVDWNLMPKALRNVMHFILSGRKPNEVPVYKFLNISDWINSLESVQAEEPLFVFKKF